MSHLRLPLSINNNGAFELTASREEFLLSRLRIFILSGSGHYLYLPSLGISALWLKLTILGKNSKFCNKDVFPDEERRKLENVIKNEANHWFSNENNFFDEIVSVKITGDENTNNGIIFRFEENEFEFTFEFESYVSGKAKNKIGNWLIRERVNVVY